MEARFKTIVHRFGISQGLVQERPRGVTVVEGASTPGARHQRGTMYIVVEVLGGLPDPGYTMERLALIMQDVYYQASGSVTGGISQALRAANDWLFEENLNSPREQRGVAGVSCAVLRDGDLYLGQMGPALAYLAQADGLRRFPDDSPWLREAIPSDAERAASPPLGVRRVIEPVFYHATPNAGDVLVLASAGLARLASDSALAQAISPGGETARQGLQMLVSGQDVTALIVTLAAAEVAATAPVLPEPESLEEMPAPLRRAQAAPPRRLQPLPDLRKPLAEAGESLLTMLRRTLPERAAPATRPQAARPTSSGPRAQSRSGIRAVTLLAILLPVLALVIVLIVQQQYEGNRRQRVADFLRQAEEARTAAVNSGDRAAQLANLRQALALVDEALVAAPGEPQALELRRQLVSELDVAAGVRRLYTLWELADLGAATDAPTQVTRFVARGADLFLLDRGNDRAYHRQLSPAGDALEPLASDAVIVARGQPQGSIAIGELVDMVWMPSGGERTAEALLILERNGSLLEYDAARGIAVLPVADSAAWKKPTAVGAYAGNFYLLDPQQNRILKYLPTAGGYTNPPVDYVVDPSSVDLSGAIDMAIDGYIYVLLANGQVVKFLGGQLQPFNVTGLDEPLRNPVALCVTGEGEQHGAVYVADAGLARVVQFDKQGQFIAQFKAAEGQPELTGLSGLLIDEAGQRIYLASGSKVYVAPLNQGN